MSTGSSGGTAAPTPAGSVRGFPTGGDEEGAAGAPGAGASGASGAAQGSSGRPSGAGGLVVPEGSVAVWDNTLQQFVVKDMSEVKFKTWSTRLRDAAWKFWAGGPPLS